MSNEGMSEFPALVSHLLSHVSCLMSPVSHLIIGDKRNNVTNVIDQIGQIICLLYIILLWLGQIILLSYPPVVRLNHQFILSSCGQVRSLFYLILLWLDQIIPSSYPPVVRLDNLFIISSCGQVRLFVNRILPQLGQIFSLYYPHMYGKVRLNRTFVLGVK